MKTLTELAVGKWTDKNLDHSYVSKFYEKEFDRYRSKDITFVEFGVCYGGSIELWFEYFSNAIIYGIDNKIYLDAFLKFSENTENVKYILGDGYTAEIANNIPEFDIFIDDAMHSVEYQIQSINLYLHKLKKDGIFIIEDVQDVSNFILLKEYCEKTFGNKYTYETIDLRSIKNRYDDLLFVIKY